MSIRRNFANRPQPQSDTRNKRRIAVPDIPAKSDLIPAIILRALPRASFSVAALAALLALFAAFGGATPFSQTAALAQSSDGRIAFISNRDGNWEIYAMNADGSDVVRLTDNSADDGCQSWSSDGRRIAFESTRDGYYAIYAMNADGSNRTRLTNNPSAGDGCPSWSPDGRRIAFQSDRDGNQEIYAMNADGSNQRRLTSNDARDRDPAWSPDGRRIAFSSERDGNSEIYVMNADGSGVVRVTNNSDYDGVPAWSPDGRRIAFASRRDGNGEIYAMNADGSNQTRLTNRSASDWYPSWSPDGRRIAFSSQAGGSDSREIYAVNVDGSGVTRITNNSDHDSYPSWGQSSVPPVAAIRSVSIPDGTVVGQSFDIGVTLVNSGGDGNNGGISISFPNLVGGSEQSGRYASSESDVQALNAGDWDDVSMYKSGDTIWYSTGRAFPADHLLVEASDDSWSSSSQRTLRLRVTPKRMGSELIRIRGWICAEDCSRAPSSGPSDQQGHSARVVSVSVIGPSVTPTHTPTATPSPTPTITPTATPTATQQSSEPPAPTPQPQPQPQPQPPAPTSIPQPQSAAAATPAQDCQIRQGVQTRLHSVRDTITEKQDGHAEVTFRNPGANDCSVDADLGVSVPTNIIISSKDGSSGTAGTVNFIVSDIKPGLERSISMDFKCLEEGEYTINFSGSYWPSGDKSGYQPITLHQRLVCEGGSPAPTPGGGESTPVPTPTPTRGGPEPPETPWLLIAGGGLVFALTVIVIVALVALGRKGN